MQCQGRMSLCSRLDASVSMLPTSVIPPSGDKPASSLFRSQQKWCRDTNIVESNNLRYFVGFLGTSSHREKRCFPLMTNNNLQMQSAEPRPTNRCHVCGATSYHHDIVRNGQAQLQRSSTLVCDGCGRHFESVSAWRDGSLQTGICDTSAS